MQISLSGPAHPGIFFYDEIRIFRNWAGRQMPEIAGRSNQAGHSPALKTTGSVTVSRRAHRRAEATPLA
jgi:hypothetical protein